MANEILVEREGRVATVVLHRPEKRNALSAGLLGQLDDAILQLDGDPDVGCIVLTGAGSAFCAGFDLRNLSQELAETRQARWQGPSSHLGLLPAHETPVVGAVNGPAVTGGLELALCCDFLLAGAAARFADTHARVGAMPGGGLTIRLPELIGIDRARRMSLTGDFIDATTALDWGLVVEVVPDDQLLERARALAATIAEIEPSALAELRRMYDTLASLPREEALREENRWSKRWMQERFDGERLGRQVDAIIERGSTQA
jgi:enoyl-CoA hydratase